MSSRKLQVLGIDHINQLLADTDEAIDFYERVYGAHVGEFWPVYRKHFGPYDNFVFKIGSMFVEIFTPGDPDHSFGRQFQRYGANWQGVLWRVPKLEDAIEALQEHNVGLVDIEMDPERRWAFTDPRSTYFSIQIEDWTHWDKTIDPVQIGANHMLGFTAVVDDAEAAAAFFLDLIDECGVEYHEDRPALKATAIGLTVGPYVLELLSPYGDGEISAFLAKNRPRIRTATFGVDDLDTLRNGLQRNGITAREGDRAGTLAVSPSDNLGVMMQFAQRTV